MPTFTLNAKPVTVNVDPDTPLLWVLREQLELRGTKYGCGVGQCGACTVHVDGKPTRSCITGVSGVEGRSVTTIEGLDHPVQAAWVAEQVPQCGYCQSGQIMAAAALLDENPRPTDGEVGEWMTNLCRCATYARIKKAIRRCSDGLPRPPDPEVTPPPPATTPVPGSTP